MSQPGPVARLIKRSLAGCCGAVLTALLTSTAVFAAGSDVADAMMRRDPQAVRTLLKQKADVNAPQADGTTALHWAARWNDAETAQALIQAGAKPNTATREGATPMFLASENGSVAMLTLLINSGADPNQPVLSHGETALMMAARSGSVDAVKLLIERGAQVSATETLAGTNALMWAAEQGHSDAVKVLVDHGANLNSQSKVVEQLKRGGLGFARPDKNGVQPRERIGDLTPLIFGVREGSLDVVRTLVSAGANVELPAVDGSSPLLVAVENGRYAIAQFLIDHGANVSQENQKGWTPLFLAVLDRDSLTTAVPPPPRDGALEIIKTLLDRGADPNHRVRIKPEVHTGNNSLWLDETGATPLLRAAQFGDLTVVRLLLDHGADPSIATLDHTTPLMVASGVGWCDGLTFEYSSEETLEVVKLLLGKGADPKAANDHGHTALHGAGFKGANAVVQLLVDRGGDLAALDKGEDFGIGATTVPFTPLNWAEGVPVNQMTSAIYRADTVVLMTKLMEERGIPVVKQSQRKKAEAPAARKSAPASPESEP